jgi:hypothetical protein
MSSYAQYAHTIISELFLSECESKPLHLVPSTCSSAHDVTDAMHLAVSKGLNDYYTQMHPIDVHLRMLLL